MPLIGLKAIARMMRRRPVEPRPLEVPEGLRESIRRVFGGQFGEVRVLYGRTWRKRYRLFPNYCYVVEGVGTSGKTNEKTSSREARAEYQVAAFHPQTFELLSGVNAFGRKQDGKKVTVRFLENAGRFEVPPAYKGRGFGSTIMGHGVAFLMRHGLDVTILRVDNPDVRAILAGLGAKENNRHRFKFSPETIFDYKVKKLLLRNPRFADLKLERS